MMIEENVDILLARISKMIGEARELESDIVRYKRAVELMAANGAPLNDDQKARVMGGFTERITRTSTELAIIHAVHAEAKPIGDEALTKIVEDAEKTSGAIKAEEAVSLRTPPRNK